LITKTEYKKVLIIREEIITDGHSPLLVITEDFTEYFIKSTRGRKPDYSILNEFLCSYLLNIWGIPVPRFSAVILNPDSIKGRGFSHFHKPYFYNDITFGSEKISNAVEMGNFLRSEGKVDYRKFVNPEDILRIGLFDIWVENTDRKPTNNNVLFSISGNQIDIYAIDHAFTFDSINYSDLDPRYINNTFNDNILETDFARDILAISKREHSLDKIVNQFQKNYYLCIENCRKQYDTIAGYIPEELGFDTTLRKYISDFLFDEKRNKKVFIEFLSRLS